MIVLLQEQEDEANTKEIEKLRAEILDLKITNKGKDITIKQFQDEKEPSHIAYGTQPACR